MKKLFLIFITSLVIFFPSFFVFYTNDDFFFLKISQAGNIPDFINFFNILKGPDGFGVYRPLTTQVFYYIGEKLFGTNPFYLHTISFLFFFGVIYLVYRLIKEIGGGEKTALIAAFLYAVSATHFGHLYYLATFQELGMSFFVLLSCLSFLRNKKPLSFIFFVLALMSKETAVITPFLLGITYFYQRFQEKSRVDFKKLTISLLPYFLVLIFYFGIRLYSYGFAVGDSYIWDFSAKKFANTVFWYILWSFNIPETLVDFIGPGLRVNPNLSKYWAREIFPILTLFLVQMAGVAFVIAKYMFENGKNIILKKDPALVFSWLWFLITLLPVVFLPIHKFTFYLTLPLIGIVFRIGYLFERSKVNNIFITAFLGVWTTLSILTVNHSVKTSWITQGENLSKKALQYFQDKKAEIGLKEIYLVDIKEDGGLPWSPTVVVKTALSDKNFFYVFFPEMAGNVNYWGSEKLPKVDNIYIINSRQFLGY